MILFLFCRWCRLHNLFIFNLFTDCVVRFGFYCSLIYLRMVSSVLKLICLWTVSFLADGAVCIFFSYLTDDVVRFGINLFVDGIVPCRWCRLHILFIFNGWCRSFLELISLWTVSSHADDAVCIFFSYLTDDVVRFGIHLFVDGVVPCRWCRLHSLFIFNGWCRPYFTLLVYLIYGWCRLFWN